MDPISASHLVQDRTNELQRTADQVRLERTLRSKPTTAAAAVPITQPARSAEAVTRVQPARTAEVQPASAQPAEARPSQGEAAGCTSAEHAA